MILVTGGAGYIGSHAVVRLLQAGYDVVVLDSLENSSVEALSRVESIARRSLHFIQGDVRDQSCLHDLFASCDIDFVMHFAGLKSVSESLVKPMIYFDNNVGGTLSLCQAMDKAGVRKLIFSSSATVYGNVPAMAIHEGFPTREPTNPYGRSKLMNEEILRDLVSADSRWSIGLLRYFNPVGAHESGVIGEDPNDIPCNLLPYISQVAIGRMKMLSVYGNDYPTPDGTGVRDYIHVMDLVDGHLCAMQTVQSRTGIGVWNLGTGRGYSVLEMVRAFERVSGRSVPFQIVPRRQGDVAECWADPVKAEQELGWKARRTLDDMMADTWRWQCQNLNGYNNDDRFSSFGG
ncbi:UDP-glucose 4-epimerase GalE [Halomonas nitroreducens]|uniref:UDP-glucose 4-epimerase n=1 Tax=Halomonas nitroreducens TaxID=447425 RepID=A0A3S0R2R5_9GAMM|nr:UDP-glucose 4-epimerase GalE [Halomonas nitroreducens]RTR05363.1 UDP-glucose 4-epimerase GalE [Halomonas nitroreducens]